MADLLPRVNALQAHFNSQGTSNLLWALAKLVDHGHGLTTELQEAVATLLPRVNALQAHFIPQHIANLLWAVAKLVDHGHGLTPELKEAVAILSPCVSILKDQFNARGIASLLWATGFLGDLISAAAVDSLVESMLCESDRYPLFTQEELFISLWGLLVCSARQYLDKNISDKNDTLECLINRLFTRLENEFIDNEQDSSVMALAASWLGRECPVEPHYQTRISAAQTTFCAQLHCALPSLKIEQEKRLHSLPPVDLFLPEHNLAIEIQGPSHFAGRDFQTRNGPTLLKIALLQKAGYDVLEIAVNRLYKPDVVSTHIDHIRQKITANN